MAKDGRISSRIAFSFVAMFWSCELHLCLALVALAEKAELRLAQLLWTQLCFPPSLAEDTLAEDKKQKTFIDRNSFSLTHYSVLYIADI